MKNVETSASPLYEIKDLRRSFGEDKPALEIARLVLPRGGLIALLGESGSGKSTLLNILGGLDKPDTGQVTLRFSENEEPYELGTTNQALPRNRLGYVFQEGYLLRNATVSLNIAAPLIAQGTIVDQARLKAQLHFVELDSTTFLDRRAWELSGGQMQRVAIARALVHNPEFVLADEPTSSLDPRRSRAIIQLFRSWLNEDQRRTVLWVTHDHYLAAELADTIVVLHKGRLIPGSEKPSSNPRDPSILRAWVEGAAISCTSGPLCSPSAPAVQPTNGGIDERSLVRMMPQGFARRLAFCELSARHGGRQGTELRKKLRNWTSVAPVEPGASGERLRALAVLFGHTSAVLTLSCAMLLAVSCVVGWITISSAVTKRVDDPALRHIVIAGDPRKRELLLTPESLRTLADELGLAGALDREAPAQIFGRLGGIRKQLALPAAGCNDLTSGADIELLVADPDEPVFSSLQILKGETVGTLTAAEALDPALVLKGASGRRVVLTREALERDLHLPPESPVPSEVCLQLYGWYPFEVAAIVDALPADLDYGFAAMLEHGSYARHLYVAGKASTLGRDGRLASFDRAAIYFDIERFERLAQELHSRGFAFSRDNSRKLAQAFTTAILTRFLTGALIVLVLGTLVAMLMPMFARYIEANQKALAVLRAHGMPYRLLVRNLTLQLSVSWALASIFVLLLLLPIGALALRMGLDVDPVITGIGAIACTSAILVLGIGIAHFTLWRWWKHNLYPAGLLKISS
jgi:putative ABC transport system ATP-binding protein